MSRYELPAEITLSFEEARVVYLALVEAEDAAPAGSERRIRLHDCAALIARKLAPDLGDLP
jgi:hypothetical protein